jgi:hypothetical protein
VSKDNGKQEKLPCGVTCMDCGDICDNPRYAHQGKHHCQRCGNTW